MLKAQRETTPSVTPANDGEHAGAAGAARATPRATSPRSNIRNASRGGCHGPGKCSSSEAETVRCRRRRCRGRAVAHQAAMISAIDSIRALGAEGHAQVRPRGRWRLSRCGGFCGQQRHGLDRVGRRRCRWRAGPPRTSSWIVPWATTRPSSTIAATVTGSRPRRAGARRAAPCGPRDELADEAAELEDAGGVEAVDRLVEDQQLGVGEQAGARRRGARCMPSERPRRGRRHGRRGRRAPAPCRWWPCARDPRRRGAHVELLAGREAWDGSRGSSTTAPTRDRAAARSPRRSRRRIPHVAQPLAGPVAEEQAYQVVLLAPLAARKPNAVPRGTARSMPCAARCACEALAQCRWRSWTSSTDAAIEGRRGRRPPTPQRPAASGAHRALGAAARSRADEVGGRAHPIGSARRLGRWRAKRPFAARWRRPGPRARGSGRSRAARRCRRCAGARRACRRARGGR